MGIAKVANMSVGEQGQFAGTRQAYKEARRHKNPAKYDVVRDAIADMLARRSRQAPASCKPHSNMSLRAIDPEKWQNDSSVSVLTIPPCSAIPNVTLYLVLESGYGYQRHDIIMLIHDPEDDGEIHPTTLNKPKIEAMSRLEVNAIAAAISSLA